MGAVIALNSEAGFCGNSSGAAGQQLTLTVQSAATSLSPGTFSFVTSTDGLINTGIFVNVTSNGTVTTDPATAGTVTLSNVTSTTLTGTYDVTFANGSFTGTFTAGNRPQSYLAHMDLNKVRVAVAA